MKVLITGGSALATALIQAAVPNIYPLIVLRPSSVSAFKKNLKQLGVPESQYEILAKDMSNEDPAIFSHELKEFLPPDLKGAVHTASPYSTVPLIDQKIEDLKSYSRFEANTKVMATTVIRHFDANEVAARLIFTGSIAGMTGSMGGMAYGMHKGIDRLLVEALADNIKQKSSCALVTYLALGSFREASIAKAEPDTYVSISRVADAIWYLLMDDRAITAVRLASKQDGINQSDERLNPRQVPVETITNLDELKKGYNDGILASNSKLFRG